MKTYIPLHLLFWLLSFSHALDVYEDKASSMCFKSSIGLPNDFEDIIFFLGDDSSKSKQGIPLSS